MTKLHTGLTGTANVTVTEANIAATMKSGSLAVLQLPLCAHLWRKLPAPQSTLIWRKAAAL